MYTYLQQTANHLIYNFVQTTPVYLNGNSTSLALPKCQLHILSYITSSGYNNLDAK